MALAETGALPTALDVLENCLGKRPVRAELEKLSIPELENISGLLAELASAQSDQPIAGGASFVGGWLGTYWSEPQLRSDLGNALLYYPNLLVLDPLADYFDDRSSLPPTKDIRVRRREDRQFNVISSGPALWSKQGTFHASIEQPKEAALRFAAIVHNLYVLEPLIRSGVVNLRSQWPILKQRANALATSVRHDVRSIAMQNLARQPSAADESFAVWDNMRGFGLTTSEGAHPADAPWETQHIFYYLAKTLAIADASGAQYVPSTMRDLELLRTKGAATIHAPHPAKFLEEVSRVVVPSFEVTLHEAVAMRRSSDAFEDWRGRLELIRRAGAAEDEMALRERVESELASTVRVLQREVASSSMLSSLDKLSTDLIVACGIGAGAAALSGGNTAVALGAASATGVVKWIRDAYGRKEPDDYRAVLTALVRSRKTLTNAN